MKILLVNNNPVVSRLTALSARKESIKLDEIKNISELKKSDYNIVFVDFESYNQEVSNILNNSDISQKVLFYTQEDKEKPKIFNLSILKPFLPSEVSAIIRETKIAIEKRNEESKDKDIGLNELITEKKDDLIPLSVKKENLDLNPIEFETNEKIEIEIENENKNLEEELLLELNSSKDKIKNIEKSPALNIIEEVSPEDIKDDTKLFRVDFKEDKESTNNNELFEIDEKNNFKDELLNFDIDSKNEIDFDNNKKKETIKVELDNIKKEKTTKIEFEEIKKEETTKIELDDTKKEKTTKILDGNEISNIKNLLNNDKESNEDMTLEDIMPPSPLIPEKIEKKPKKKKKSKKPKKIAEAGSKVILNSLGSLPVDDLRRLLLGAEVHITIKFPKE